MSRLKVGETSSASICSGATQNNTCTRPTHKRNIGPLGAHLGVGLQIVMTRIVLKFAWQHKPRGTGALRENILHHPAMHIRQAKSTTLELVIELFVIDAQ